MITIILLQAKEIPHSIGQSLTGIHTYMDDVGNL